MLPSFKSSSPEIILKSVDFPHPEGPTKTINYRSFISKSTFFITRLSAKDLEIFLSVIEAIVILLLHPLRAQKLKISLNKGKLSLLV